MKLKIMPPAFLFMSLMLSIVSHFAFPIRDIIYPPYTYLGVLAIGAGVVLNIWADNRFKKKRIPIQPYDNPIQLDTSGPFRISRHPMYLGMFLILLGASVITGSLITFIFPFIFLFLVNRIFVSFEERNLERIFGEEYLAYKKKVRRWI